MFLRARREPEVSSTSSLTPTPIRKPKVLCYLNDRSTHLHNYYNLIEKKRIGYLTKAVEWYKVLTHVNCTGEFLRLGQDGKSVGKFTYVVLCLSYFTKNWLYTLERYWRIKLACLECSCARIDGIEESVKESRLDSTLYSKSSSLEVKWKQTYDDVFESLMTEIISEHLELLYY